MNNPIVRLREAFIWYGMTLEQANRILNISPQVTDTVALLLSDGFGAANVYKFAIWGYLEDYTSTEDYWNRSRRVLGFMDKDEVVPQMAQRIMESEESINDMLDAYAELDMVVMAGSLLDKYPKVALDIREGNDNAANKLLGYARKECETIDMKSLRSEIIEQARAE